MGVGHAHLHRLKTANAAVELAAVGDVLHRAANLFGADAQLQVPPTAQGVQPPSDPLRPQLWLTDTSAAARASLIAALVDAGLPVAGLWPVRERLQDRYAQDLRSAAPTPQEAT